MSAEKKVSLRDSIATRMLFVVLGLYLLIVTGVTMSHVWMEYRYQKANIIQDLGDIEGAFADGLAVSLWGLDKEALRASVEGMLRIPTIVGVKIIDADGATVATGGVVTEDGETGDVGLHIRLSGCSDEEASVHQDGTYNADIFEREFSITCEVAGESKSLGRATIYSSSAVIYRRMKVEVIMLAGTVALVLLSFFILLPWAVNRYVRRPLDILTSATADISLDTLGSFSIDTKTPRRDEIRVLEETMTSMVADLHDAVSMREETKAALRQSEEKFRSLFEQAGDYILLLEVTEDKGLVIADANHAACKMHGYTREEFIGTPITNMDRGLDDERLQNVMERILSGEALQFETTHLKRDGTIFPVEVSAKRLDTKEGPPLVLSIERDITERKKLEDQLRQSEKMQAIGQLAGGIAHDFNNQLVGVLGYADLLVSRLEDPTLSHYAENIKKAATRSADLTKQLLAFSRKGKNLSIPVEINKVLVEVVAILEHSIDKRIEIRQHLNVRPSIALGDPTQLQNVFLNLALNARDAMPKGGKLIFETDIAELDDDFCQNHPYQIPHGRYLKVSVTDAGAGMSQETQRRIFEPFFTTKEQGKGTGMGLASVYGTVRNHQGAITVYSELGHGTTFNVYLPLSESEELPEEPIQRTPAKGTARVLMVDDEEMVRNVGAAMLRALGYEVMTCQDGEEAVECYRNSWKHIDLVILDMIMPRMNGREAFMAMREINPDIRAILSSGYSINGEAQGILDEGVLAFIGKPFDRAKLSDTVAKVLRGNQINL
jgi:PAS domain S-box-containing protein